MRVVNLFTRIPRLRGRYSNEKKCNYHRQENAEGEKKAAYSDCKNDFVFSGRGIGRRRFDTAFWKTESNEGIDSGSWKRQT